MTLTKKDMLLYWERAVNNKMRVWALRCRPKFKLMQTVKVVTKEPSMGTWAFMDELRKQRRGQMGIIIDIEALPDVDVPLKYSNYDYRIKFRDGEAIIFVEEHLMKV